jgi:dihydroflavonol-4-reductase
LPSPKTRVPHAVAMGFAVVDQFFVGTVMGKEPRATVEAVRMGRKKMFASSAKAERELGYRTVPVNNALERAIEWFQSHGYAAPLRQASPVSA